MLSILMYHIHIPDNKEIIQSTATQIPSLVSTTNIAHGIFDVGHVVNIYKGSTMTCIWCVHRLRFNLYRKLHQLDVRNGYNIPH